MKKMNRLFVCYKPLYISSNKFLHNIKKKYGVKKAGFSGTLDPFACGTLIVAFGQYTKLFNYLQKTPKKYKATLWLGARSETLDLEQIQSITTIPPFSKKKIKDILDNLKGKISYIPPKYSAKKINGQKAYNLAKNNQQINLTPVTTTIYNIKLLNYSHPFLSFEIEVSEGGYIRSIAQIIAKRLGTDGSLSFLERVNEGKFVYQNEKALDVRNFLKIKKNFYLQKKSDILLGKKLKIQNFQIQDDGEYYLEIDDFLTIIEIKDKKVKYKINGVKVC